MGDRQMGRDRVIRPNVKLALTDGTRMYRHEIETANPREAALWLLRMMIHLNHFRNLNPSLGPIWLELYPEIYSDLDARDYISWLLNEWEENLTIKIEVESELAKDNEGMGTDERPSP